VRDPDPKSSVGTPIQEVPSTGWRRRLAPLLRIPTPVIFVGSVVLAILVLWIQGALGNLIDVMADAQYSYVAIAAPIYLASLLLLCYRWHVLVEMAQGTSNFPRASEAFLTSVVINYAAPIGLAVPSRAALTKRALGLDARATGTIAVWEIGMDVIVLGLGTVLWLFLANGASSAVGAELSSSARLYATFGLIGLAIVSVVLWWFLKPADRRARAFGAARRIIMAPRERPREALLGLLVTLVYWIIQGVVLALLVNAFNVEATFVFVLGLTTLPILVGMLSPIPGGAVVREALMYVVARLADIPGDPVIAAALIYRFALFAAIPILYIGVRWWIARHPAPPSDHTVSTHLERNSA
jgi:uncharacterized membrane protein YbhN (UPF0104 family)